MTASESASAPAASAAPAASVTPTASRGIALRITPPGLLGGRRSVHMIERNVYVYRRGWIFLVSGFFEPFFYLLSIGVGLSGLVGPLHVGGEVVPYTVYVAPGLLASSAMNGALFDSTFNLFHKLKFAHTYESVLSTPLTVADVATGEMGWSLMRSGLYAASFMVVMAALGYVGTPWVGFSFLGALLVAFAFSAAGMATTTYMRSWQDFDMVLLGILPMFLFSATFYPLGVYPGWLAWIVRCTPLYQGVALARGADLGIFDWAMVGHAAYLAVMGVAGLVVTSRRLRALLLP
jgi:lipooligosaccharide transport system permease protein